MCIWGGGVGSAGSSITWLSQQLTSDGFPNRQQRTFWHGTAYDRERLSV